MSKDKLLPALLTLAFLFVQGCQQAPRTQSTPVANAPGANSGNAGPSSQPPAAPGTHLKVGDAAPDFTLTDTEGKPVKLSDFRGKKNVALAFYVLAFTGG